MPTIDAQVHCYARNHPGRPWAAVLAGPPEVTAADMIKAMDEVGVDGALLVSVYTMYRWDESYAVAVQKAHPGRFVLGMGVSHPPQVDPRGHSYGKPVATMRAYLEAMDAAEYTGPKPAAPVPRLLGALRPAILELAATMADGAHPYLVPVEHTLRARSILGPRKLLATEQLVLLEKDPGEARRLGREAIAWYLTLPNYTDNLRWLGFSEPDLADGGSDALVDALVAWGDEEAVRGRVLEHLEAGADHVCVQPIGRGPDTLGVEELRRLGPALLDL